MSIIGKSTISIRKKDVQQQRTTGLGFKKLTFAHKATAGDSSISLGALVAPSEMPTHTNPTSQDLLAANLLFYKGNLTLISSLRGALISDLSYKVVSSGTIEFIGFTAEENEIFYGVIDASPRTGMNFVDARPIVATGTLADGTTDFNVGQSFRVNNYPSTQCGDVVVYRNGVQQFRNVGNSPSGEGNYYEVQAGNGYGQVIRFNNAPAGQDDSIMVISNGLLAERPDGSMMAVIETLAGQVDKLVDVVSEELDIPSNTFQTAPNEPDLKQFGDQVLDHENRVDSLELYNKTVSALSTSSGTKTPPASNVWLQMTGNSITLTPGTWILSGSATFQNNGSNPAYTQMFSGWFAANGNDTGTLPAGFSSLPQITYSSVAVDTNLRFTAGVDFASFQISTITVTVNANATVFHVPLAIATTPANARIIVYANATKIKDL